MLRYFFKGYKNHPDNFQRAQNFPSVFTKSAVHSIGVCVNFVFQHQIPPKRSRTAYPTCLKPAWDDDAEGKFGSSSSCDHWMWPPLWEHMCVCVPAPGRTSLQTRCHLKSQLRNELLLQAINHDLSPAFFLCEVIVSYSLSLKCSTSVEREEQSAEHFTSYALFVAVCSFTWVNSVT